MAGQVLSLSGVSTSDRVPVRALRRRWAGTLNAAWDQVPYVFFDLETTGGNPLRSEVIEIAGIRCDPQGRQQRFSERVAATKPLPWMTRKITGLRDRDLRGCRPIRAVFEDFIEFAGDAVLVSHNTLSDLKHLRHLSQVSAMTAWDPLFLCTHLLAERFVAQAPAKSLAGVARYLGIEVGVVHRAEADAELTRGVFFALMARRAGAERIVDLIVAQGDVDQPARLGPDLSEWELAALPAACGVVALRTLQGQVLVPTLSADRLAVRVRRGEGLGKPALRQVFAATGIEFTACSSYVAALFEVGRRQAAGAAGGWPEHWGEPAPACVLLGRGRGQAARRVRWGRVRGAVPEPCALITCTSPPSRVKEELRARLQALGSELGDSGFSVAGVCHGDLLWQVAGQVVAAQQARVWVWVWTAPEDGQVRVTGYRVERGRWTATREGDVPVGPGFGQRNRLSQWAELSRQREAWPLQPRDGGHEGFWPLEALKFALASGEGVTEL